MTKNKYAQKRKWILLGFTALCLITVGYICLAPPSTLMTLFVVLCLFTGYFTFLFAKKLQKKSTTYEKRKMTLHKKMQNRLLDKQRGKVVLFREKKQG